MREVTLLVLLAGCLPPPPVPVQQRFGPDGCPEITADAAVRINQTMVVHARADEMKVLPAPPDFNGDGRPDIVVRRAVEQSGPLSQWHAMYVRTPTCPQFVGMIQAATVQCMDTQSNGLCDLDYTVQAGAFHQHMLFDGVRYRRI